MEWDEFHDPVKQAGGRRALVDAIENHQDESKEYVEDPSTVGNQCDEKVALKENSAESFATFYIGLIVHLYRCLYG